jgi:integrase
MVQHVRGRWRPLIITAAFTGLRASELRGLRWSDVDLEEGRIHVRQRADRYHEMGMPKSGAGQRAANKCSARWTVAGREVFRLVPKMLSADFNDIVMGAA